jgi:hypothetical protein
MMRARLSALTPALPSARQGCRPTLQKAISLQARALYVSNNAMGLPHHRPKIPGGWDGEVINMKFSSSGNDRGVWAYGEKLKRPPIYQLTVATRDTAAALS